MQFSEEPEKPKGRLLRLKRGYNPNSSSVGSQLPFFLAVAVGSGVVSLITLSILTAYDKHIRKESKKRPEDDERTG